ARGDARRECVRAHIRPPRECRSAPRLAASVLRRGRGRWSSGRSWFLSFWMCLPLSPAVDVFQEDQEPLRVLIGDAIEDGLGLAAGGHEPFLAHPGEVLG